MHILLKLNNEFTKFMRPTLEFNLKVKLDLLILNSKTRLELLILMFDSTLIRLSLTHL